MERNKKLTLHKVIELIDKTNERLDIANERLDIANKRLEIAESDDSAVSVPSVAV